MLVNPIVVKEGTDILLDWEDVTDKSMPVTYTLQLASNDSFSTGSILLEKTELPDSEYLMDLSETEPLRPRRSYYWRVRAVDSAANAGEWTKAGEIKIASVSTIPDWLKYTLVVLGALLILFIWYRMHRAGKRSS